MKKFELLEKSWKETFTSNFSSFVTTLYRPIVYSIHMKRSHMRNTRGLSHPQVTLVTCSRVSSGCHSKYESNGRDDVLRHRCWQGTVSTLPRCSSSYAQSLKERKTFPERWRGNGMAKIKNSFHESNTLEFSDAFILSHPFSSQEKRVERSTRHATKFFRLLRAPDDFSSSMLAGTRRKKKKKRREGKKTGWKVVLCMHIHRNERVILGSLASGNLFARKTLSSA